MKILAPVFRRKVNQLAHAHGLRKELEIRDRWMAELTQELDAGASFAQLQEKIARLSIEK